MARDLAVVPKPEEAKPPSESERITRLSSAQRSLRSEIKSLGDGIDTLRAEIADLTARIALLDHWTRVGDGDNLGGCIVDGVGEFVGKALGEIDKKISELEASNYSVRWGGTWSADSYAKEGELWTEGGALWLCTRSTDAKPPGQCWRLIVKSGEYRVRTAIRSAPRVNKT
jgi:hypothetical protein